MTIQCHNLVKFNKFHMIDGNIISYSFNSKDRMSYGPGIPISSKQSAPTSGSMYLVRYPHSVRVYMICNACIVVYTDLNIHNNKTVEIIRLISHIQSQSNIQLVSPIRFVWCQEDLYVLLWSWALCVYVVEFSCWPQLPSQWFSWFGYVVQLMAIFTLFLCLYRLCDHVSVEFCWLGMAFWTYL